MAAVLSEVDHTYKAKFAEIITGTCCGAVTETVVALSSSLV
ncbi:hypothetical protein F441_09688 [Phytophthora nicotianae CJ01A1]|uniref:Uncharacterized protein n=6 Tax=Phytophthora nicotianae TaxID=4792 RepID=W2R6A1_PHYN3|nr:hypothetical protein PPTG_21028 [Phytophthora nicotianae INRA-310]ETI45764.1 hypothetical protein F443_09748 [Phytophthora nicotianae P1569]ETK85713.1 hypothetical protein L915_09553 [Phytophthora nicotianae]ETO74414.1 hypothetical protein F444_09845 [Phytophthora nicotianae P1976]ETP15587.1 hypothetical protein F441_09688 [Phytophthora nicotianae CJ01A1]ETP43651.1 hypothetical protein F442_09649 [Phytophthora nicotianae P10297]